MPACFNSLRRVALCAIAVLSVVLPNMAVAQSTAPAKKPEKVNPAFVEIADEPGLPRVMLVGDSISMGYTPLVREALKGKANVHHPAENCGPSSRGVEKLDAWLGDGRWDVIHFNFGLHDIVMKDGKQQVSLEDYEKNLRKIVERLKRTGAKLIWCSTTPAADHASPMRNNKDVIAYNAVAKKVMEENGIAINDLYAFAEPQITKIQRPKNVHYTEAGYKVLAGQVTKAVAAVLPVKAAASGK